MPNAKTLTERPKRKILLLGPTGSGKSTQALTLPGRTFAYLFDPNAILSLEGHDIDYEEFLPDNLSMNVVSLSKEGGKDRPTSPAKSTVYLDWERDFEGKLKDNFFATYDNIVMDSFTTFLDMVMDRVLALNNRLGGWPQQDDYGPQMIAAINVVRTMASLNLNFLCTGHLEIRQDDLTKRIFRQPVMTGRLKERLPILFSDVFVTEVKVDAKGNKQYTIMTAPDRMTQTVRTSIKGLSPFEDVTLDFTKPLQGQGISKLLFNHHRS